MKSIYSILIAILYCLICSCYTKQQAIEKFCNQDSIKFQTTIYDTLHIDSVQIDTVFNNTIDSVYILKDKLEIVYINKNGKIFLDAKCKGDTIYYEKKVLIEVPVDCPKQSRFDQIILEAKWWILAIISILILVIFKR
jgi:hypothetical protein